MTFILLNTFQFWPFITPMQGHKNITVKYFSINTHWLIECFRVPAVKCNNSCPQASYSYHKETTTPQTHLPHTCCEPGGGVEVCESSLSLCHCFVLIHSGFLNRGVVLFFCTDVQLDPVYTFNGTQASSPTLYILLLPFCT